MNLHSDPFVTGRGTTPRLLIDADYLAYMVAAVAQQQDEPRDMDGARFECVDPVKDVWLWVYPDGLVEWMVTNEIDKLKDKFNTDTVNLYLTGDGNFREELAFTKPYKGTRRQARPYHYQLVRDTMMAMGAELIEGMEADDKVCIEQLKCHEDGVQSVIVGPDKDLRTMFGWNYNPRKDELDWITPASALLFYCEQMITGDSVDNIPGLPRKGIKFFEKLVDEADDPFHLWFMVQRAYREAGQEAILFEQANLLHMRRFEDDTMFRHYDFELGYNESLRDREDAPCLVSAE